MSNIFSKLINLTRNVTGILPVANGGTGLSALGTNGQYLRAGASLPAYGWQNIKIVTTLDYSGNNYTVTNTDGYDAILAETSSTARTITLPTASSNTGRRITVVKTDTGTGTLTTSSFVLYKQNETVSFMSDGSSWLVIDFKGFSSRYTPTDGGIANSNITSITYGSALVARVAPDMISMAGSITARVTATTTLTTINVSLPVASNLGSSDLWGSASMLLNALTYSQGVVNASAANDVARIQYRSNDNSNDTEITYVLMYQII